MLTFLQIRTEALKVARKHFRPDQVKDVLVESDVDAEGNDSVRVTIVLASVGLLTGARLSAISLDLVDYMNKHNDRRYPYTHYATARDMRASTGTHD